MSAQDLDAWMERQREDAAAVDACVCGDPWDTAPADAATAERLDCAEGRPVCRGCAAGEPVRQARETFDPECPL